MSSRAHSTVTLLKLGILCTFLVAGLYAGWGRWENLANRQSVDLGTAKAMLFSLVYISYAYTGWNAASYLAGEVAEPGRRLPQAILIGTSLVVVLYLGLNTVYSLALPAGEIQRIAREQGSTPSRRSPNWPRSTCSARRSRPRSRSPSG